MDKCYSSKKMATLPQEAKKDIAKISKHLRQYVGKPDRFNRELLTVLDAMYAAGMKDALGGEVVRNGRCIHIEEGTAWEIECPYCKEKFDINLEGMLPDEEGVGVMV